VETGWFSQNRSNRSDPVSKLVVFSTLTEPTKPVLSVDRFTALVFPVLKTVTVAVLLTLVV
jgi:hypothetical protein